MQSSMAIAAANSGPKDREPAALGAQRLVGAADVRHHEHVEHHHRAGVDHHLSGREELGVQEQEEHRQRHQVRHQGEHAVEGVAQDHHAQRPSERADRGDEEQHLLEPHGSAYSPSRRSGVCLGRIGEQHLLGEDQVAAAVVGQLVVVAHRDRVERAGHLAVAAEDAARHVDLVDLGVALAGRHLVLRRVLGGHHADALGRAGGRAQRAAHALLELGVLEAMELVPPAEARVDRRLLLGVLDRDGPLHQAAEGGAQPAQRLAEHAVDRPGPAGLGAAVHLHHVLLGIPGRHQVATSTTAVTSTLRVASGSRTFQPNDISWS